MKNRFSILLSMMGILAIFCTLFIWYWLATVGVFIGMGGHSYGILWVGAALGLLPGLIGIGILMRREWARRFLMAFWFLVVFLIIGSTLGGLDSLPYDPYWFSNTIPWLVIAFMGILHIIFLRHRRVKELFLNKG